MKTMLKMTLLLLIITFTACEDIVDSEENILITKIENYTVDDNQMQGVLLPLEVGNKWYYDVSQYDYSGNLTKTFVDSMIVMSEELLDNEKFFNIHAQMWGNVSLRMTNTDKGLWFKCDVCENSSYLLASYPANAGLFASGITNLFLLQDLTEQNREILKDIMVVKNHTNETINVPKGEYECIKYSSKFNINNDNLNKYYFDEYFSKDVGLVKAVNYYFNSDRIFRKYELRDNPTIDMDDCLETAYEFVSDVLPGESKELQIEIENNTNEDVILTGIHFESDVSYNFLEIMDFEMNFPLTLETGTKTILKVNVSPIAQGRYFANLKLLSNIGCFYDITIEGLAR